MEKNDFIYFVNQYYIFTSQLENNINNLQHVIKNVCYLIEESWLQNLVYCFNKFNRGEYSYQNVIPFPREHPKFINDFSTAVDYIRNKIKFKIISQQLIDLLYDRNDIIRANAIYYAGNNKLIIEIMEKDKKKALYITNSDVFIILKNNISNIYQELISLNNVEYEINKNPKYNNYIIHLEKLINTNFWSIIPFQPNNNIINLNQRLLSREQLSKNSKSNQKYNIKQNQTAKVKNISQFKDNYSLSSYRSDSSEYNGPKDNVKNKGIFKTVSQSSISNSSNSQNFSFSCENFDGNKTSKTPQLKFENISLESNIKNNIYYSKSFINERNEQKYSSILCNSNDKNLKQDNFMNYFKSSENKINSSESEVNNKDNTIKILQKNDKKDKFSKNEQFQKLLRLKENEIIYYKNKSDILNKEIQSQKSENNDLNRSFNKYLYKWKNLDYNFRY